MERKNSSKENFTRLSYQWKSEVEFSRFSAKHLYIISLNQMQLNAPLSFVAIFFESWLNNLLLYDLKCSIIAQEMWKVD